MTREEFIEIFELLSLNYHKCVDDSIIDIWYNEFKDVNKEKLKKTVIDYIKEEKVFPTINKLLDYMNIWVI